MPRETSGAPLPRWARISRKKDEKETALSAEDEECYLRTRLQLNMAHRIDEALQSALKANVSPTVENITDFFKKVTHNDISPERPNKRPRTASEDPLLSIFEMTPSPRYPITMLPLAVLHGPPSFLDRQEIIKFIVNKMRHDHGKERPAVCWLRSASSNSLIRHCGTFLQEILRQCIGQEPNPKQFHRLWQRTSRQTNASYSQPLITWAQYTESFDSIIILIDTVECMPDSLFQDFLRILTQLRSEHRLPIQVVLLAPPGQGRLALDSSAQGTRGILIRDFFLPTSKVLHDFVWGQVFIERPLPIPLAPSVLRSLQESFDHHHASAVRSMQMLKQALAHTCTPRGAFLLGKDDMLFKKQENQRIKFFQSYHHSEETVKYAAETATNHSLLSLIMRLLHRLVEDLGDEIPSGVAWAEQEFSASCFDAIRKRICDHFANLTKLERMTWLAGMRNDLQRHEAAPGISILRDLQSQLDEIIVLTEEVDRLQDDVLTKDLSQMVSEWVYKISVVGATIQARQDDDANRFSPAATATSTVDAIVPRVRGHLTDAMLHPASNVDISDINTIAPCLLFLIMQDRVVISREECFEAFVKRFQGSSSLEELCSAFSFGMHQLCHCGLVLEKLGSKSNVVYERTALVWCSGS